MQWYVDSRDGSDSNDGRSPGAAFATVAHAGHVAKSGDTVMIAPGAYEQDLPQQVAALRAANIVVAVTGGH